MSEKENIPIKENEDGSVLAKIGVDENEQFEEETKAAAAEEGDEGEEAEEHAEGGEVGDEENEGESEDEREKIREARREERKLKKELAKQREASAKHKISALERRNEELAKRLAAVESSAASFQFAQVDKAIEDEATRVEYAKMKLLQASQQGDAEGQVEYLEALQESKARLNQIQAYKKQQLEQANRPKQNVPNPVSTEVQKNATDWLKSNKWYDPQARDTDSRIAKVVDQDLAAEGWDPADPEYWEELDNRLSARLPHRYAAKTGSTTRRAGPTASSRTANPGGKSAGTFTLSSDRVKAIKEAGAWDDPVKRNKMIKAYANFDRQNRN
jgi:hypothetical protein